MCRMSRAIGPEVSTPRAPAVGGTELLRSRLGRQRLSIVTSTLTQLKKNRRTISFSSRCSDEIFIRSPNLSKVVRSVLGTISGANLLHSLCRVRVEYRDKHGRDRLWWGETIRSLNGFPLGEATRFRCCRRVLPVRDPSTLPGPPRLEPSVRVTFESLLKGLFARLPSA